MSKQKDKEKQPKSWWKRFHKKVVKTNFYPYTTWFLMFVLAWVAIKK